MKPDKTVETQGLLLQVGVLKRIRIKDLGEENNFRHTAKLNQLTDHCTADRIKQQSLFHLYLYLFLWSIYTWSLLASWSIRLLFKYAHSIYTQSHKCLYKMDLNSILPLYAKITEFISTMILFIGRVTFAMVSNSSWSFHYRIHNSWSLKLHEIPLFECKYFLTNVQNFKKGTCHSN